VHGFDTQGVTIETVIAAGPPAQQICAYAAASDVDLIVTSTHGLTGFAHILIGSTAEHVVRYARCPVLVVPRRDRASAGATSGRL
jgi:nucleotide-binding universal stress UspA family protein